MLRSASPAPATDVRAGQSPKPAGARSAGLMRASGWRTAFRLRRAMRIASGYGFLARLEKCFNSNLQPDTACGVRHAMWPRPRQNQRRRKSAAPRSTCRTFQPCAAWDSRRSAAPFILLSMSKMRRLSQHANPTTRFSPNARAVFAPCTRGAGAPRTLLFVGVGQALSAPHEVPFILPYEVRSF